MTAVIRKYALDLQSSLSNTLLFSGQFRGLGLVSCNNLQKKKKGLSCFIYFVTPLTLEAPDVFIWVSKLFDPFDICLN